MGIGLGCLSHCAPSVACTAVAFPPDSFALLSRVRNKPYDVFGCWLTETSLISGNLHRIGDITSCSVLWLNNAFQVQTGTGTGWARQVG